MEIAMRKWREITMGDADVAVDGDERDLKRYERQIKIFGKEGQGRLRMDLKVR